MGNWVNTRYQDSDEDKSTVTALYLYQISLGDRVCCGELVARSIEEAREFASKFGGAVMGRITEEAEDRVCPICGKNFPFEEKQERTPAKDWPDEL